MNVRSMSADDLKRLIDWAAEEGWNPGTDDVDAFHAADPDGFFLAEIDGAPVAGISVVNHSDSFAFLGLYICRPAYRGQGIGFDLWQHALSHAGSRTVGLDGVPDQQENYRKSGFVEAGETFRLSGNLQGRDADAVRLATGNDLPRLVEDAQIANGYASPRYLLPWFSGASTRQTFLLEDGQGFATIRLCREGAKIGPLVAETPEAAIRLLHSLAARVTARPLIVDVPGHQTDVSDYLRKAGFECGFTTARMYRGPAPVASDKLRGVTTLELG